LERLYDSADYTFTPAIGTTQAGHSDFDDKPIYQDIKTCVVANGAVVAYEGDPGFSRTPDAGDVMVEIPLYYYKIIDTDDYRDYLISDTQRDGFLVSPRHAPHTGNTNGYSKIYASAYTLNTDYRSISGNQSIVSITRATARTGCRARGTGYSQQDYAEFWTVVLLYLVEVANFNSQAAIGDGFTNSGNSAQIATGGTDYIPYHTGRASTNATASKNPVKYRGMENLWGNIWAWCDGASFNGTSIYVNTNPATYTDGSASNYTLLSYAKTDVDGYQKALGYDPSVPWAQMCTDATGSATTYVADSYYRSTGWRVLRLGGRWSRGTYAGLFDFSSDDAAASVDASIGSRLLFLPS
jgi:hypothetical protein